MCCRLLPTSHLTAFKPFFKQITCMFLANRLTLVWCKRRECLVMARALQVRLMQSFSCHRCPFLCCCLDDLLYRPSMYRQQVTYRYGQAKKQSRRRVKTTSWLPSGAKATRIRNVCAALLQSFGRLSFEFGLYKLYQVSIDQVTWHTLHSWHQCAHFPKYCMPLQRHLQDAWHLVAEATLDLAE